MSDIEEIKGVKEIKGDFLNNVNALLAIHGLEYSNNMMRARVEARKFI